MKSFIPIPAYSYPSWTNSDFDITVSPINSQNPFLTHPHPHTHPYYQLVFVTTGSGTYEIDFKTDDIIPGRLFWIAKDQVHAAYSNSDFSGICISISENFLIQCINTIPHHTFLTGATLPQSHIDGVSDEIIYRLQHTINNETPPFRTAIVGAQLTLLCIDIIKKLVAHTTPTANTSSSVSVSYRQLIDTHFRAYHDVEFYADQLHLNANYLNELIAQTTGHSASHWIHDRVVREAKRLLFNTLNPISEIASHLGFEDPSYFYRYFKRYTGTTPNSFRKSRGGGTT